MTTYDGAGRTYYELHKSELLQKERENKRWISYYERNKDAVRKRNLERYYKKKEASKPAEDPAKLARLEALISEMKELLPTMNISVKRQRRKKQASEVESVNGAIPADNKIELVPVSV